MKPLEVWTARAALGVVLALAGLLALHRFNDLDVLWHVRTGEWILEQGEVPREDPFGAVTAGRPWVDVPWLAQVGMAKVAGAAGLTGLHLAAAGLVVATLLLASLRAPATPVVLVAALLFVLNAWFRFHVRPDLLSLPLVLMLMGLTERLRRRPGLCTVWLVLLTVAWANLHGSFVLVPIVLGASVVGSALSRPARRHTTTYAVAFLLCLLAPLVNPYGLRIYTVLTPYLGSWLGALGLPAAERLPITEWESTVDLFLRPNPMFSRTAFVMLAGLALFSFLTTRGRPVARAFAVGSLAPLALLSVRNILPFAAGVLWAVTANERERLADLGQSRWAADSPGVRAALSCIVLLIGAVHFGSVLTDARYVRMDVPLRTGSGPDIELLPEGAVQWLATHEHPGRAFNNFDSGTYLLYRLYPDFRPYVDARVVDADFFRRTQRAARNPDAFEQLALRDGIDTVVLVHPSVESVRLLPHLAASPQWTLAFRDHNSTIHVRSGAAPPVPRAVPFTPPPLDERLAYGINTFLERFKRRTLPAAELTDAFISGILEDRVREETAYRAALRRAPDNARARAYVESRAGARPDRAR
jgi:hypothetical protein